MDHYLPIHLILTDRKSCESLIFMELMAALKSPEEESAIILRAQWMKKIQILLLIAHGVVADDLRGACLASKINAIQMRETCRVKRPRLSDFGHAVGDGYPVFRVQRNARLADAGIILANLGKLIGGEFVGEDRMRPHKMPARCNAADDARQLNRRSFNGALADADGDSLARVPLAVIIF